MCKNVHFFDSPVQGIIQELEETGIDETTPGDKKIVHGGCIDDNFSVPFSFAFTYTLFEKIIANGLI